MEKDFDYQENDIELQAKIRRISRLLTRQEIANAARVSQEDVDLFERGQPMDPVARRKLLNAYLYKKTINQCLFDRFCRS